MFISMLWYLYIMASIYQLSIFFEVDQCLQFQIIHHFRYILTYKMMIFTWLITLATTEQRFFPDTITTTDYFNYCYYWLQYSVSIYYWIDIINIQLLLIQDQHIGLTVFAITNNLTITKFCWYLQLLLLLLLLILKINDCLA